MRFFNPSFVQTYPNPSSATAQLYSRTISPKVVHDLVSNSVSNAHYIIQRRMRFCSPWGYKVVCNSVSKAYYTIQSRRYLAYLSMLNLALDLSCGRTSQRTCSAQTCPNSAVSKAMVNTPIIHDVSLIPI